MKPGIALYMHVYYMHVHVAYNNDNIVKSLEKQLSWICLLSSLGNSYYPTLGTKFSDKKMVVSVNIPATNTPVPMLM